MSGNFSRGPADDAADCSGSDAASTAAAAAANLALLQLPRLPVDILSIIASHAPNDARGQLRLCSKHFAGAVDPLVRSLTFKAWPGPLFTTRKRLRHVTALHLQFSIPDSGATSTPRNSMAGNPSQCSTDTCTGTSVNNLPWDRLTAMIQQLPHLTSLGLPLWDLELPLRPRLPVTYTEHLTRLTRLDLEDTGLLPVGLQLPGMSKGHQKHCTAAAAVLAVSRLLLLHAAAAKGNVLTSTARDSCLATSCAPKPCSAERSYCRCSSKMLEPVALQHVLL